MKYPKPLIKGRLIKRYKRFLADVELEGGEFVTVHVANSGSMMGLTQEGNPVFLRRHDSLTRKLPFSLEIVSVNETLVGVNTFLPNLIAQEAIEAGLIPELLGYDSLTREVRYGVNSRVDLLLGRKEERCFVEVKNVTLVEGARALFPDAVSARGQKHILELVEMVKRGHRSVLFYVVQRNDAQSVAPADAIDPQYGKLLRQAVREGLEVIAYQAKVTPEEICLREKMKVVF